MGIRTSFFVLTLLVAVPALGEETASTWQGFVEDASRSNPDLAAAREIVERAEATAAGAFSGYLPQLSFGADYSHRDSSSGSDTTFLGSTTDTANGATGDGLGRGAGGGARDTYSVGLDARQALFTGFRLEGEVARARAQVEEARAAYDATAAQVSLDLTSAFANLVFAQEQVDLAKQILERRNDNLRLIELRYDAGREHKGSFLRIGAAARQAEFQLASASRAVSVAQRQLARVLGRPDAATLRAEGGFPSEAPTSAPDFRTVAETVPAFTQAAAQERSAAAGVTVAKSGYFPTLDAVAALTRRDETFPPEDDAWSAGVSLSLPLFTGGKTTADVRGAKAEERRAKWNSAVAREQAVVDLETAYASYEDAAESVEVQTRFVDAAETRAEIARAQYTNGLLSFEDWDLIENDRIDARTRRLATERDRALAKARWDFARGARVVR